MSRAHAVMMNDASVAVSDAIAVSRAAIGVALVIALLVGAALSFAAHGDERATPDEIAQLGD